MSQTNSNIFGTLENLFGTVEDVVLGGADVLRDVGIISDEDYESVERRFQSVSEERKEYENQKIADQFNLTWQKTWPYIAAGVVVFGGIVLLRKL